MNWIKPYIGEQVDDVNLRVGGPAATRRHDFVHARRFAGRVNGASRRPRCCFRREREKTQQTPELAGAKRIRATR